MRLEERLLLGQLRLGDARLVRRREPIERLLRRLEILLRPERMVVAHRLAPVGHGEVRVGLLRLLERLRGFVELEVVERLDADEERLLRGRGAEVGKVIVPNSCDDEGAASSSARQTSNQGTRLTRHEIRPSPAMAAPGEHTSSPTVESRSSL